MDYLGQNHSDGPFILVGDDILYRFSNEKVVSFCKVGDHLSVLYAASNGMLLGWGLPEVIEEKFRVTSLVLFDASPYLGEDLKTYSFMATPETVEELNCCINTTGRVLKIEERIQELLGPSLSFH